MTIAMRRPAAPSCARGMKILCEVFMELAVSCMSFIGDVSSHGIAICLDNQAAISTTATEKQNNTWSTLFKKTSLAQRCITEAHALHSDRLSDTTETSATKEQMKKGQEGNPATIRTF